MAFRLARLLRLRTQLRERAQDEVGRMRADLARTGEAVGAARGVQHASRAAEAAAAARGLTGETLLRFRRHEAAARAREDSLARERTRLAEELVARRHALVARRREERQLELLRERGADRSDALLERATMVLLDDLALRRRGEWR
jgi:flagellar export protein FliJ